MYGKNAEKARHVSEKAAALFFLEGHWNHYGALDKNRQSDFCVAAAVKSDMRNGHFFGQSHKHKKFYFKASDSFLRETASHRSPEISPLEKIQKVHSHGGGIF